MPKYRVTTDQGAFDVTLDTPPASPEELSSVVSDHLAANPDILKQTAPQPKPGIMSQVASGAWQGVKNLGSGIAAIPGLVANTPGQIAQDVTDLATNPGEALPKMRERAVNFAKGMIPMRETGTELLSGKMPSAETVSREATEAAGGYALGKYAIPGAVGAAKKVTKSLPGSSVELNEIAASKLRDIPEAIRPTPGIVDKTYKLLDMVNAPKVSMAETISTVDKLLKKEATLAYPDKAFVKILNNFKNKTTNGMSFGDIQNNVVDLGEKIGQMAQLKGTRLNEMNELFSALHRDAASGVPIQVPGAPPVSGALQAKSQIWDTARMLARRNFAANDLNKMFEQAISTVGDGYTQVRTNQVVSKIEDMMKLAKQDKRARLFVESFQPGELESIVDTLKSIGKEAPTVPPKAGTPVGSSGRWVESSVGGLTGAAVGGIAGHPGLGAMVGAPAGVLASNLIGKAMMTETGRSLVRRAMTPTGTISPQGAALIGAYLKSQGESQ